MTTESAGAPEDAVQSANAVIARCLASLLGVESAKIAAALKHIKIDLTKLELTSGDGSKMILGGEIKSRGEDRE